MHALLAQLDRAFGYGPKGQGFESLKARQKRESHFVRFPFFLFRALRDEDPEGFVEAAEKAR